MRLGPLIVRARLDLTLPNLVVVLPNMVQHVVEVPTAPQHADFDLPHWVGVLPTVNRCRVEPMPRPAW